MECSILHEYICAVSNRHIFQTCVWVTQTGAVIAVLYTDWFCVWTRGSQFIWLKTDKFRIKDWKLLILSLFVRHACTHTHTHTPRSSSSAWSLIYLLHLWPGRKVKLTSCIVLCQIIRRFETTSTPGLECSGGSVKLDLCNGCISKRTLDLHFRHSSALSAQCAFQDSSGEAGVLYVLQQKQRCWKYQQRTTIINTQEGNTLYNHG